MDIFASVQNGISTMLATREPEFLRYGQNLFLSLATIVLAWQGITMMFSSDDLNDKLFGFAKSLLFVSIGYALITFYEAPIPGIGTSFSNLITDQTAYFASVLDAGTVRNVFLHLDATWQKFITPSWADIPGALIYVLLLLIVVLAQAGMIAVVAFGLVASAVCGLLGPLFVPFFIVPKLDFLFWGWFKAFLQYSFIPVVAYAYLMVFEGFLFKVLDSLPTGIAPGQYLLYVVQVCVVLIVFVLGLLQIPALTSTIFSGGGGMSVLPDKMRIRWLRS